MERVLDEEESVGENGRVRPKLGEAKEGINGGDGDERVQTGSFTGL